MKKKRFTPEQVAFAMRQHESGTPVAEIVRKMAITEKSAKWYVCWKEGSRQCRVSLAMDKSALQALGT